MLDTSLNHNVSEQIWKSWSDEKWTISFSFHAKQSRRPVHDQQTDNRHDYCYGMNKITVPSLTWIVLGLHRPTVAAFTVDTYGYLSKMNWTKNDQVLGKWTQVAAGLQGICLALMTDKCCWDELDEKLDFWILRFLMEVYSRYGTNMDCNDCFLQVSMLEWKIRNESTSTRARGQSVAKFRK